MAKEKTLFACTACGYETSRWVGRCPGCGAWNTMVESAPIVTGAPAKAPKQRPGTGASAMLLREIPEDVAVRSSTGISELDRVLGGGIVEGALMLIGGDPGIGKSTLLLQVCANLCKTGKRVLYVSGEESAKQLKLRANRLGIRVPGRVIAYHDHNERDKADGLLDQVEQGATVLVVSDAGMPTINDPGLAIVRRAIERGLPVTCAPGPSAVLDALCLSGLPTDRFCYEGFLPRKHSERVQHLRALKSERRTIVFYETLHRIDESMADLLDVFGPNRKMALCRELTKDYEQIRRGTIAEIRQSVVDDPPRGEMVLVIAGASEEEADAAAPATLSIEDLAVLSVDRAQEDNLRIKDAISQVVAEHPLSDGSLANRKQVYNAVLAMKG